MASHRPGPSRLRLPSLMAPATPRGKGPGSAVTPSMSLTPKVANHALRVLSVDETLQMLNEEAEQAAAEYETSGFSTSEGEDDLLGEGSELNSMKPQRRRRGQRRQVKAFTSAASVMPVGAAADTRHRHPLFNLQASLERAAMRRTQCSTGVQTGTTLVAPLGELRDGLAAAQGEVDSLRMELRRLKAQTHVELARGRVEVAQGLVQRIVEERSLATHEQRQQLVMMERASREQLATEMDSYRLSDGMAAQRLQKATDAEMARMREEHAAALIDWKRQCFYYKTQAAELKAQNNMLQAATVRHGIKADTSAPKEAFKVIDDVAVAEELAEVKRQLFETQEELDTTRLSLRAAYLDAREARQLYAEGQREILRKEEEMAAERTRLEERIDMLERRFFGRASEQETMVREQLKNDIENKIQFQLRQEYKVALAREQRAQQALRNKMAELLELSEKEHQKALKALKKEHSQIMARRSREHRTEVAELNVSWQRKVVITQESISKLKDTESAKALVERQERLLALMARVREMPGQHASAVNLPGLAGTTAVDGAAGMGEM